MSVPILLLFLVGGCAPPTQETIDRRDEQAYEQAERETAFYADKRQCDNQKGVIMIERWGQATRRQVLLDLPGRGDSWHCAASR